MPERVSVFCMLLFSPVDLRKSIRLFLLLYSFAMFLIYADAQQAVQPTINSIA
jgi:hypothetical protein